MSASLDSIIAKIDRLGETAHRIKAERDELLVALARLYAKHDPERTGAMDEPDQGCLICTAGATPNRLNTGICPLHQAMQILQRNAQS